MSYRGRAKVLSRLAAGAVAGAVLLVTAGCGTRMTDAEIQHDAGIAPVAVEVGQTDATDSLGAADPGVQTGQPAGIAPSGVDTPTTVASAVPGVGGSGAVAKPTAGAKPAQVKTASGPKAACAQKLSPIPVGQSGVFSGVLGPVFYGNKIGLAAWAAEVNAAGGVQCHPIALTQMDDGGDPAKTTSNTQYLINTKKVVALVSPIVPITLPAMLRVADAAGVPLLGGDGVSPEWYTDPNAFMHGPGVIPGLTGGLKSAIEATSKKKVGMIHCVEATICSLMKQNFQQMTEKAGGQPTTVVPFSLTQPNFTSECQAFKSNGTEILFFGGDGSSIQRFYSSCGALGYYPVVVTSGIAIAASQGKDPNIRKAGVYLGSTQPPYVATNLPAVAKFRATMARFAPTEEVGEAALISYAGGKMFEAALAAVYQEARGGDVTSATVLNGLYAMDGDDLEGLSPSKLRFKKGQPTPSTQCYFTLQIGPDGFTDRWNGQAKCL